VSQNWEKEHLVQNSILFHSSKILNKNSKIPCSGYLYTYLYAGCSNVTRQLNILESIFEKNILDKNCMVHCDVFSDD